MPTAPSASAEVISDLSGDLYEQIAHLQPLDRVLVTERALMLALMSGPSRQRMAMTAYTLRLLLADVHNVDIDNVAVDVTIHHDAADRPPDFNGEDVAG
jgi:hypothetical protein